MQPDSDYIHWLMIEELTGEISEADAQYLYMLLENDPKIKHAYALLQEQYTKQDLETKFERFKVSKDWKDVPVVDNRSQHIVRFRYVRVAAAAAILVAMLLTVFLYQSNQRSGKTEHAAATFNQKEGIKLQVAGGKTVDLTVHTGQVGIGNGAVLNNNSDSLSYKMSADRALSTAINTLTVPPGMDYKVLLSDGTEIWLNSATILKFPFNFSDNKREVTIKGEAYLAVAKDPHKPFIVHTDHGIVKVLGTEFNVNTYDSNVIRVSLIEGAVQVDAGRSQTQLNPGEQAVYNGEQSKIDIQRFDKDEVLSWRRGVLHFYDKTVKEISEIFPRWYGINIIIDDQKISKNRFSGIINRNESVEKFLKTLKETSSINSYEIKNGQLHLK